MKNIAMIKLLHIPSNPTDAWEIEYHDYLGEAPNNIKDKIIFQDTDFLELIKNKEIKLHPKDLLTVHIKPDNNDNPNSTKIIDCVHKHYPARKSEGKVLKTIFFSGYTKS